MKRFSVTILYALVGYIAGGLLGYFLVVVLSSNTHDSSVEAATTGAFVAGPPAALIATFIGAVRGKKR